MATISTHNGSIVSREHNCRNRKITDHQPHIDPDGMYEVWHDEKPRDAYHRLFDAAVKKYNEQQTRSDRKIHNYYSMIDKNPKKHPVYEMIVGVYPAKTENIPLETQREILKEFVDTWKERNPNLELIGAYFHNDEEGEPHVHIDYVPIAHGYERGLEVQTGLVKALEEQGFVKEQGVTAQIQWQRRENMFLETLCEQRGIFIEHPMAGTYQQHVNTELYKAERQRDELLYQIEDLEKMRTQSQTQIDALAEQIGTNTNELLYLNQRLEKIYEKMIEIIDKCEELGISDEEIRKSYVMDKISKYIQREIKGLSQAGIEMPDEHSSSHGKKIK